MASWNIPALINKISEDVPAIKALLTALFKWTDADTTDVPVGAKRLQDVTGGKQMQEYSGSAWGNVGKLMHDVDMLDGKHASTAQTADTIPVRDANGTIPGNISGNAATATEASSLASGYTVPVANGGTGATTEAGARASLGADNASNISSGILDIAYGGTGSNTKNFVDLTENQNVGGTKTFSLEIKSTAAMLMSTVMTGVSIADATRGQFSQKKLAVVLDKDNKVFAGIAVDASENGSRLIYPYMRNRADTAWIADLQLKELADGTVQTLAKTPPAAANDTQIATTAWVTTFCETTKKYLYKTGDVMTGILDIKRDNQGVRHWSGTIVKGTNPTATRYVYEEFLDKNGTRLGWAGIAQGTDGSINLRLECVKQDATTAASVGVGWDKNKVASAWAPTPPNNDRSTKIATTEYIGNCVIPANTRMLFQQSAAPTGWTKETGSGYNNTALRFVTGNVANRTNGTAFSTIFAAGRATTSVTQGGTVANQTAGGTISKTTAGGTVGNKALSEAMLAKHAHYLRYTGNNQGHTGNSTYGNAGDKDWTSNTGSGANHNHGFTGTEHGHTFTGTAHSHTFTGSSHSHKIDMNVNYIDCIIAKKA